MILSHGTEEVYENKEKVIRYKFFTEFAAQHGDAIYGLDRPLMQLVNTFKSAAKGYGTERRVLLLHGPVGSSKSTIARLLKQRPGGVLAHRRGHALLLLAGRGDDGTWHKCPMHEEPLHWCRTSCGRRCWRSSTTAASPTTYEVTIQGDLCPFCRQMFNERLAKYDGDWHRRCCEEIKVYRLILSEQDRIGIGTFQPKDEKNQDSTELTGDINYRKIAEYGTDSDPRAFNFDGELNIANRGLVEFIEVLKLDVAFLYDLLGASQEHKIKPKKFAQTDIDEVILGHTNEPEYRRLQNNEFMEALRDRTVKIDVPYVTRLQRRDQDLREGLQRRAGQGQAHRPAHDRDRGDVGGADAAGAAQARQPDAAAEAQALQRQDAARLHRGQRHRAEARGRRTRACTASARATSRTRSPTPWSPTRTRTASTRSWCCTSWRRACGTTR